MVRGVIRLRMLRCVQVEGAGIDIDEHRCGSHPRNRLGGGEKGEGGRDHFVPGTDPQGVQHQHQGIGPVGDTHTVIHTAEGGHLLLQSLHFRTEDVPAALQHPFHGFQHLITDRPVLCLQIH